jgi:hypothetical protein
MTKKTPGRHVLLSSIFYPWIVMRGAFLIRLGRDTKPADGRFEGWVEEVDSGEEFRFRSSEELLRFLGRRFELIQLIRHSAAESEPEPCDTRVFPYGE